MPKFSTTVIAKPDTEKKDHVKDAADDVKSEKLSEIAVRRTPDSSGEKTHAGKENPVKDEWRIHHIQQDPGDYTDELNGKILKYLVKLELITPDQAKDIEKIHIHENKNPADAIIDLKIMKESEIGRAIAEFFSCSFIILKDTKIEIEALHKIPEEVAKHDMVIAFKEDENAFHIAMVNPSDEQFLRTAEKKTGKKIKVYYSTPRQITVALKNYQRSLKENIDRLLAQAGENINHLETLDNISTIFDTLILMAYDRGASDVHIEPLEDSIRIRFRIDGILGTVTTMPPHFLETIVNHVKVLSKLRIDEHSSAQDGRFNVTYDQTRIHLRVSVVPTHYGEKTVMRLLPAEAQELTLSDLGYLPADRDLIEKEIMKSSGIILVTGPTGSGKTTTLYSLIKKLNEETVNISTIEDPIEYGVPGVNQIQVNSKTNLTFAEGLKSLLRQDPNILMVGEIRDFETGKIAMNASLTGHLVFSTLHTNSAPLAPLRLVQMGVDPYLITATVNLIIAQRLVRKICPYCMASYKLTKKMIKEYEDLYLLSEEDKELFHKYFSGKDEVRLFKGKGCKKCGEKGHRGRTVIAEVMRMGKDICNLILKQASESEIENAALKGGMTNMTEDGFRKVLQGVTTLDELFRVLNQ
jgi:type IV pilus assembly protein PilB